MSALLDSHFKTGNFSHGYLIAGDFEDSVIPARKISAVILNKEEEFLDSHPDFYERAFDSFSLDDLRDLAQKAGMKPILAQKQVFILKIFSIHPEAILSFSVFFENVSPSSHFFILVPSQDEAPAILRSRLTDISEKKEFQISEGRKNFWRGFFEGGPTERLALSKDAANDKKAALVFLNELEAVMEEKIRNKIPQSGKNIRKIISFLEEIKTMRRHLFGRASYPKMIIEHFALTLPKF